MATRRALRGAIEVASALSLAILVTWAVLSFLRLERASHELPRLFLQLERAIGYDGFIHNFMNVMLRPAQANYVQQAMQNYRAAEATIAQINDVTVRIGIGSDLSALDETLHAYRDLLETVQDARDDGLSLAQLDQHLRVSDVEASADIARIEQEIFGVMDSRQRLLRLLLGLGGAAFVASLGALAYGQRARRRELEEVSRHLAEHEAYLLQAERIARLGRWKADNEGVLTWSKATMDICGVTPETFPGTEAFFWSLVPQGDHPRLIMAVNKAVAEKGGFVCIHRILRPDNELVIVVDSGECVLGPGGEVVGFVGTLQDITQLADIEEKLRQAQKMEAVGNLAGGMAHDLNNILAVILGSLELLQMNGTSSAGAPYLKAAMDATNRGSEMIQKVLSFARRSALHLSPIQINEMVHDVVGWSTRLLPATIEVKTALLGDLWKVDTDRTLAQNALLSLMLNARDAMPEGGILTIETANIEIEEGDIHLRGDDMLPGRYVMLAVSDTGHGMSDKVMRRIFDPFFTTKPAGEGSGLGLSMVQGFMKQSGGSVRVYSEPGVGTTFKLFFRVTGDSDAPVTVPAPAVVPSKIRGSRILMVEDNSSLLETMGVMLAEAGFVVSTARSGDEALAMWSADSRFDLLLTDLVMPGKLQGTQLAQALRRHRPDLPVIFMSGYSAEATMRADPASDTDIRLMKPISRRDLISAVVAALSERTKPPISMDAVGNG